MGSLFLFEMFAWLLQYRRIRVISTFNCFMISIVAYFRICLNTYVPYYCSMTLRKQKNNVGQNCIRVYADELQIKQCRESIDVVSPSIEKLSKALNLAGNEVRLKILYLLHQETKLCVCDLSDMLNMSSSAISQHLRKMKDGFVVSNEKVGQTIFYSVRDEYTNLFQPFFKLIENNKALSELS